MALEDIRNERIKKANMLREAGIDPYPAETSRTHAIGEALKKFAALEKGKKALVIAGRVMARREHGGSMFLDVRDGSGTMQVYLKKDVLADEYRRAVETIDIGDVMEAEGTLFLTKKKEQTLEVRRWAMLAKTLRSLPEKWHGLQDVEERFRKRYLDILMNDDVRRRFELRSRIIAAVRDFHITHDFLEVETPVLQPIPGGTLAKPFTTHHNALDIDLYLRIAPELYLKRLLVAGFDRVFEIARNFRNEGIDATHNPEFTMLECYAAYWDEDDMMEFVEDLFISLAKELGAKKEIIFEGKSITFKKPFSRIKFKDLLARFALITEYGRETRDSLATRARQLGVDVGSHESKGKIADEIYKKICRPHLVQPTFVTNHPLDISPLAKRHAKNPEEVRRLQLIVGGFEMTNGWAELDDPMDERGRFEEQEKEREGREEEAMHLGGDFREALESGMPPAAGLGIGIDRLVMLFTDAHNIREVLLFPTMRPR